MGIAARVGVRPGARLRDGGEGQGQSEGGAVLGLGLVVACLQFLLPHRHDFRLQRGVELQSALQLRRIQLPLVLLGLQ